MTVGRNKSVRCLWHLCWTIVVLSSASVLGLAQNRPGPGLTGVAHIAIRVTDIDSELKFLEKLGFEKAFTHEEGGRTAFVFVKVNDSEFLEIHPHTPLNGTGPLPLGFNHICYTTDNADAEFARWKTAGLTPTPVAKGPDGTLEFGVMDPSGAMTEALEILPDSQPGNDRGQHLGSSRVSDWLIGIDMPVSDAEPWKKFYEAIGFKSAADKEAIRETSLAQPALEARFHRAAADDRVQILFATTSLKKAAAQLKKASLAVEQNGARVVVKDPDGNPFVFESAGGRK